MPNFNLSSNEAADLAAFLFRQSTPPQSLFSLTRDPDILTRGKDLVEISGCMNCHDSSARNTRFVTITAEEMRNRLLDQSGSHQRGCISGKGAGVRYGFDHVQRQALTEFIKAGFGSLLFNDPAEFAVRQIASLNCVSCHAEIKGISSVESTGAKLRTEWLSAFIGGRLSYKPRPERTAAGGNWMNARMPAFAELADVLAKGLSAMHGFPPLDLSELNIDTQLASIGRSLVSEGGFACTACHALGQSPPTQVFEAEGINLAYATARLRPSFFKRWMLNPIAVEPGTRMPAFFDENGKSPMAHILNGDAERQIDSIWHYLHEIRHEEKNSLFSH